MRIVPTRSCAPATAGCHAGPPLSGGGLADGHTAAGLGHGALTHPALEAPDGHRLEAAPDHTGRLALRLLGTHAAADGRQQGRLGEDLVCAAGVALADAFNEA